jgi:hypothetical protein
LCSMTIWLTRTRTAPCAHLFILVSAMSRDMCPGDLKPDTSERRTSTRCPATR